MRKKNPKLEAYRVRRGWMKSDSSFGMMGAFAVPVSLRKQLIIVADDGRESGWEHVSVHAKYANSGGKVRMMTPTWEEMCHVKELFWDPEEAVMQLHPSGSVYVNQHPHCLHLWRPVDAEVPLPPVELVGMVQEVSA